MERNRQSARECRARKKLRYDYLEELVVNREQAVQKLLEELRTYEEWCRQLDQGLVPQGLRQQQLQSNSPVGQQGILLLPPLTDNSAFAHGLVNGHGG
ncbi:putative cAMP-responsive element-binding protein-like 2 [Hypsibius exemplaris]|uniref:cAMP-responsive element-binding protein-like 2 n=1 Tax=Hypsibius exemplaris TaxID=2072580 RepID=A0A1W0WTV7_HYPEX|nr:putative cAMP-responsive element-binding protein-like 2 [Hypsibius exemplaris]